MTAVLLGIPSGVAHATIPDAAGVFTACKLSSDVWVANSGSDNVTKLRATDGVLLGTLAVGDGPSAVAFDGSSAESGEFQTSL
jgi:DNA-binding beta-propeller fold protein YncE